MAFDWAGYLTLAEELGGRADDEAALRSAISRAYYAAFCSARNRLRNGGVSPPATGDSHTAIRNIYRLSPDPRAVAIGTTGDRLRRMRNRADYHDVFAGLAAAAQDANLRARHTLESLAALGDGI